MPGNTEDTNPLSGEPGSSNQRAPFNKNHMFLLLKTYEKLVISIIQLKKHFGQKIIFLKTFFEYKIMKAWPFLLDPCVGLLLEKSGFRPLLASSKKKMRISKTLVQGRLHWVSTVGAGRYGL